jgi:RNA polymerase sigma factor (sigma-70 family)
MADGAREVLEYLRRLATSAALASQQDDVLLRQFAQEQDASAFAGLLQRHGPMVLAVCQRLLSSAQDAEDAFQATFIVLTRRAGQLRDPARLAPWLYGDALRVARKMRQRRPMARLPEDLADMAHPVDREGESVLDEELSRLPSRYRDPLVLCCLEGLTRDEAAQRLGLAPGALKGLLERGRDRLRQRLLRREILTIVPIALPVASVSPELASHTLAGAIGGPCSEMITILVKGVLAEMTLSRWQTILALALFVLACSGVGFAVQIRSSDLPGAKGAERTEDPKKESKREPQAPEVERIQPRNYLVIKADYTLPDHPIDGTFRVEPSGKVPLGVAYGRVDVKGLTVEEAEKAVQKHLRDYLKGPVRVMVILEPPPEGGDTADLKRRVEALEKEVRDLRSEVKAIRNKVK